MNNSNMTTKILGSILIILIVAFVVTIILMNINKKTPEEKEKIEVNSKLSDAQVLSLFKFVEAHVTKSPDLELGSITDESMIVFASDYLGMEQSGDRRHTEEYVILKVEGIEEKVEYIFGKQIDYSKVSFEVKDGEIYIPSYPIGGDLYVYKFRSREYDATQEIYTVYIDALAAGPSNYSEIHDNRVIEYDQKDVAYTLVFKYKQMQDRRILLAFNQVINYNNI